MERVGADETLDTALGGAVKLLQPKKGFRYSVDAVLLPRFAGGTADHAVDIGCGSGIAGLCLYALGFARRVTGVDIQQRFVEMAIRSSALNGWEERFDFIEADIRSLPAALRSTADLVISNPPFRPLGQGRISPDQSVAVARHEVEVTLPEVVAAARHLLKSGGRCCLIYPAGRAGEVITAFDANAITPSRMRLVHPTVAEEATFVLLEGVKGAKNGRTALKVEPPLFMHPDGREEKYSAEANRLLGSGGVVRA